LLAAFETLFTTDNLTRYQKLSEKKQSLFFKKLVSQALKPKGLSDRQRQEFALLLLEEDSAIAR
jgi:hypothetical protein